MGPKLQKFAYFEDVHIFYFSSNFDMFAAYISFNLLFKGLQVVFKWIFSVGYGFLVNLDCSNTGAGGSPL